MIIADQEIRRQHQQFLSALQRIALARNSGSADARYLARIACRVLEYFCYSTPEPEPRLKESEYPFAPRETDIPEFGGKRK